MKYFFLSSFIVHDCYVLAGVWMVFGPTKISINGFHYKLWTPGYMNSHGMLALNTYHSLPYISWGELLFHGWLTYWGVYLLLHVLLFIIKLEYTRTGRCCILNSKYAKSRLPITHMSVEKWMRNFAQYPTVSLPCFAQNSKTICQMTWVLWKNKFGEIWV